MNIYLQNKVKCFILIIQLFLIQFLNIYTIMYEITDLLYLKIAEHLADVIGSKSFYSGVVTLQDGDVECRLCSAIIVSRTQEGSGSTPPRITRLSPVWWELKTSIDGKPLDNDFSFATMLTYFY